MLNLGVFTGFNIWGGAPVDKTVWRPVEGGRCACRSGLAAAAQFRERLHDAEPDLVGEAAVLG